MLRTLEGGFELDDDPDRIDSDAVWAFLSTEAYWNDGRPRELFLRQLREASRVVGIYRGGRQVGFARTLADGKVAWLADVWVLAEYRGQGLGTELVRECVERGPYRKARWFLGTRDAHGLFAKFGFGEAPDTVMMRRPLEGWAEVEDEKPRPSG